MLYVQYMQINEWSNIMKFLDCHMHQGLVRVPVETFLDRLDAAGVDSAIVFSYPPAEIGLTEPGGPTEPGDRIRTVMEWAGQSARVYPFYWIDPTEDDAGEQVDAAVEAGIMGFKVICSHYYPYDEKAMRTFEHIAHTGKPLLFHSGIIWIPQPASIYQRPAGFECLMTIPDLRFALAHVSWPWTDECLAVYGKWQYMKKAGKTTSEMWIDTTPGTPPIYREDVLRRILTIGYDIENNLMLGVDNFADYDVEAARRIFRNDRELLTRLGATQAQQQKYFYDNAKRFVFGKILYN